MNIVLYSTHCPMCNVLSKKLDQKKISYEEINDINKMRQKGFLSAPMLEVDGELMDFKRAVDWLNALKED